MSIVIYSNLTTDIFSAPPAEEPAVAEVTEKMDELKVKDEKSEETESAETKEEKTDTDKATEE